MRLSLPLLLETLALALAASAARLAPPPVAMQTTGQDGAYAALQRPSPAPTAAAELPRLHGRDYTMGADTCGFGSAQTWITYECYLTDATCMNISGYRGCCTSGYSSCLSTIWTTCEDYDSRKVCGSEDHTRCCASGAPYCLTWELKTDATTYTVFDCDVDDSMRVREMLATPLSLITTTDSGSATVSSSSSSLTSSAATASSSTSETDDGSASGTASSSSEPGAVPAGAIAGGVVGGLVVVGLTVVGWFYFRRRGGGGGDREKASASPPPPPAGPQEIASSDTRLPLGPSYGDGRHYDPKTGTYGVLEAPDTALVEAPGGPPPAFEAPNTPALGQESNRAELG